MRVSWEKESAAPSAASRAEGLIVYLVALKVILVYEVLDLRDTLPLPVSQSVPPSSTKSEHPSPPWRLIEVGFRADTCQPGHRAPLHG